MKVCFKCNCQKPLLDFYKHNGMADGHLNKCKECTKKDVQENRKENIDYYTEYEKSRALRSERVAARKTYSGTRDGKAAHARSTTKYRNANPERYRAQVALNNAVRDGKISPWPACAVPSCSESCVEAHHSDYNQPLAVIWLCNQHHREIHN